jgi:hypothetical protein
MEKLSRKDHDALVLRFFESKNFAEVGAGLGASESAAKMRVNRALEKLRNFFSSRGVDSTTSILAGGISANFVQATPEALAKSVTAVAVGKGAVATASTITLVKGVLDFTAWMKVKAALIIGAVILAAGAATFALPHWKQEINRFRQSPGGAITMDAVDYVKSIQRSGQAPGFLTNKIPSAELIPGLYSSPNGVWHMNDTNVESYPVFRTIEAITNGRSGSIWSYNIVKASRTNGWQLKKAWLTDKTGKVQQEYSFQ